MDRHDDTPKMTSGQEVLRAGLAHLAGPLGMIVASWPRIVGPRLAQHSTPTRLTNGTLSVRCTSAAWAQTLNGMSADLVEHISANVGIGHVSALTARAGRPAPSAPPPAPRPLDPQVDLEEDVLQALRELVAPITDAALRDRVLKAAIAAELRSRQRK